MMTTLIVGQFLPTKQLEPVTRLDLIKYAGASGDFNPIHTIDEEAEKAGLPGIIAHGMWSMGNLASLFSSFYEFGFIEDYKVKFRDMVFLGDVLTLSATLIKKEPEKLLFEVVATNQNGKDVIRGEALFSLY